MTNLRLIFTGAIARPLRGGRMLNALMAGFGSLATTLGFRLTGRLQGADERWAARDRVGALLKTVGSLIAVAGVGLAIHATARIPPPAPIVVTHTVALPQFGLQVTLPSTWTLEPGQARTDFVATHSETGATLAGAVALSDPPAPDLDATINRIIENQRGRGTVENISRGVMAVGLLDARWVKLSFQRQGEPVRVRTVAVQRGLSTLTLTCTGGAAAQKACNAAIRSVTTAR